jgi:hypothetical protein
MLRARRLFLVLILFDLVVDFRLFRLAFLLRDHEGSVSTSGSIWPV